MKKILLAFTFLFTLNVKAQIYHPQIQFLLSPNFLDVFIYNTYDVDLNCSGWVTIQHYQNFRVSQHYFRTFIQAHNNGYRSFYLGPVSQYYSSVVGQSIYCQKMK